MYGVDNYGEGVGRAAQATEVDYAKVQYAEKMRATETPGRAQGKQAGLAQDSSPVGRVRIGVEQIYARVRGVEERLENILARLGGPAPTRNPNTGAQAPTPCGGVLGEVIAVGNAINESLNGIDDKLGYLGSLTD